MKHYTTPKEHQRRKPRKVFQKTPKFNFQFLKEKSFTQSLGSWKNHFEVSGKAKLTLKLLLSTGLMVLFFILYLGAKNRESYIINSHANKDKYIKEAKDAKLEHHYKTLIHSAEVNLKHGRKRYAAREFLRAYKLNNHGREAAMGLTELLVHDCSIYDSHCELAREWIQFCKVQFGDSEKIQDWEWMCSKHL